MIRLRLLVLCATAIASAALHASQDPAPASGPQARSATPVSTRAGPDLAFYRPAVASGGLEVELARHALTHATSENVRDIARHLVNDHGVLNERLAEASDLAAPPPPPAQMRAEADAVRSTSASGYDAAWLAFMAEGHAKSIELYGKASTSATLPATRQLATQALPTLRRHAQEIRAAQQSAGPS